MRCAKRLESEPIGVVANKCIVSSRDIFGAISAIFQESFEGLGLTSVIRYNYFVQ